jgi:hypothetical protein
MRNIMPELKLLSARDLEAFCSCQIGSSRRLVMQLSLPGLEGPQPRVEEKLRLGLDRLHVRVALLQTAEARGDCVRPIHHSCSDWALTQQ